MNRSVHICAVSQRPLHVRLFSIVLAVWVALSMALAQSKPATVLFMCPHGAAKSILASASVEH